MSTVAVDAAGSPDAGTEARLNTLAVVALAVGFILYVGSIALFLGLSAQREIDRTRQRGGVVAIIAMVCGALWLIDDVFAIFGLLTRR
jgi:hypothetical protein